MQKKTLQKHSQFKECLWDGYNNTGHNKIIQMNVTLLI